MRQLMNFVKNYADLAPVIGVIFTLALILFVFYLLKHSQQTKKTILTLTIATIGLGLTWFLLDIPEERIHVLEYALLGWLIFRDSSHLLFSFLFIMAVGFLDEGFQYILPYRYFQLWDVFLNGCGGLLGIIIALTSD
jgi:hypothetical protein